MQNVARWALRRGLLLTVLGSLFIVPSPAIAAKKDKAEKKAAKKTSAAKTKVALGSFTGPKSDNARDWAAAGLGKDESITVVANDKAGAVKQGSSEKDIMAAAKATGAAVVVLARVNLQKKVGWSLTLWIHNGADGKLIKKEGVRGGLLPALRRKLEAGIGSTLAPHLETAAPPAGAEAAPAEAEAEGEPIEELEGAEDVALEEEAPPPADEEPPAAEAPPPVGVPGHPPLDLRVGFRFYQRELTYTDSLYDLGASQLAPLPHKTSAGAPMFIFSGNVYPAAYFTTNWAAHIGIMVGYEQGFLTKTTIVDPLDGIARDLDQTHTEFFIGGRYRLMLGTHEIVPYVTWGKHQFSVENDLFPYPEAGAPPANTICTTINGTQFCYYDAVPDVAYSYIDLGVAPRFVFGSVSLGGHAAYRIVNSTGGLEESAPADRPYDTWFPNASGSGVSVGIQGGYAITEIFEILVGADFTRYGFDFNHIPTPAERAASNPPNPPIPEARVAGGATDTYVSGWLGLGIRFPGAEIMPSPDAPDSAVEDPENEDVEELDF